MQSKTQLKRHNNKEQKQKGSKGSRHGAVFLCQRLSNSSIDLLPRPSPELKTRDLSRDAEDDSDTDLSDCERAAPSSSSHLPPQLNLRPELIEAQDLSHSHKSRGQPSGGFHFPDFLPPPFNSWSLNQLAVFYNMKGCSATQPRPVGSLERYLERLLQLEWHQIQTVQEETGGLVASEVVSSCHRLPNSASARLSSPKCILQCQRAFPLSFLSCLAGHSALLSGCTCALCQIRYSSCVTSCSRSAHARHSRLSPLLGGRRVVVSVPRRSYSESRVPPLDRDSCTRRVHSPMRTNSHLRRMQALGNLRNPVQGASGRPQSTAREPNHTQNGKNGDALDCRMGALGRRSGSEQRRSRVERKHNGSQKRCSDSECRRGGQEFKDQEIKPDAVAAIKDNSPMSKHTPKPRPSKAKQVDFVT